MGENSVWLALSLLLLPGLAHGGVKMSVRTVQELAVSRSPLLRAKAKRSESDRRKAQSSGLLPNPSLSFQLGQADSGGVVGSTFEMTVSQAVPFPAKRNASVRIMELKAQLAEASEKEAAILVQQAATLAAVHVASLAEVSKHSIERQRRFRLIHDYLRSHPQVSPSQRIESALIENQIRILEKGMLQLSYEKRMAELELNYFLQLPEPPEVEFEWIDKPVLPNKNELLTGLEQDNPAWVKKSLEVKGAEEELRRAKLEWVPDLTLGFDYRIERVVPQNRFYSGMIGISLPLWDRGQHSVPAARAALESEQGEAEVLRRDLSKEFEKLWARAEVSAQILRKFPQSLLEESERKFDEAEREFRRGRISTSVFLATDSQIHETLDSVYESQTQFVQALGELYQAVGRPLEWRQNQERTQR